MAKPFLQEGWHFSRYLLKTRLPETGELLVMNLMTREVIQFGPVLEYYLSAAEKMVEGAGTGNIEEDTSFFPFLKRKRLLVNYDELAMIKSLGRGACMQSEIVSLSICPTLSCNFDCLYCFEKGQEGEEGYAPSSKEKEPTSAALKPGQQAEPVFPGEMSKQTQDQVVKLAQRMLDTFRPKKLMVCWFGGEPLLAPKVIENLSRQLLSLAQERGIGYSGKIITNGYLLNEKNVAMLERSHVKVAQVTLDGIGKTHDQTRHLKNGGETFEKIFGNLTRVQLPFQVMIRQNVHEGNRGQTRALREKILEAGALSKNDFVFSTHEVISTKAYQKRGGGLELLEERIPLTIEEIKKWRKRKPQGYVCSAQLMSCLAIDEKGFLYKCLDDLGQVEKSFGHSKRWNPKNPIETTDRPDQLTSFLNTALPLEDEECEACIWLPVCGGGCPHNRLEGEKRCFSEKSHPEEFVRRVWQAQQWEEERLSRK